MDKWHGGRELARFTKNSNEDVRLTLHNWGVGRYLDIRVWSKVRPTDETPSSPTEAGLVLDIDLLPEFRRAIFRAMSEINGPWAGQDARPQASGHEGQGTGKGESGDSEPDGEKRGAETGKVGRSPEGEGQGQGRGWL